MKDRIWNCCVVSLEGLKNEQKAWMQIFEFNKLKKVFELYLFDTFLIGSD